MSADDVRWKRTTTNKDALKRKTLLPYHVVKEKKRKLYKTRNSRRRRRRRRQHGFLISGTTTARRMGPISDAGVLTAKAVGERKKKEIIVQGECKSWYPSRPSPHIILFSYLYIYCTSIYIYIYIDMIFFCSPLLYQEVMPRYDPEIRSFHFVCFF